MVLAFLVFAASAAAEAPAAPGHIHSPDVEARLAPLIGDWTVAGKEATYRDTCVWFGDRAFVVCSLDSKANGEKVQAVLGYSKARERFTYLNYASDGTSRYELGFPQGERGIVFTDERMTPKGLARVTTYTEPQADGRVRFRQEMSINGGPWQPSGEVYYVRRKS
jgi:hypothetical protein